MVQSHDFFKVKKKITPQKTKKLQVVVEFLTEKRKNYNEKEDRSCLNRLLQMVICIFCLFQFLKNLINPKNVKNMREKKLGKGLS